MSDGLAAGAAVTDARDAQHVKALRPAHLGLALAVISAAQLMVVLDASIVNVALPSVQRALHFSPTNLVWVVNGYSLAFGGLLLLGGRSGDLFGRRRMFMVGIGVFSLASLLGGLATSEAWLIVARVVQGTGGAIVAPAALSLIASTFPEGGQRNRAMGVYAAMAGAGGAIGVLLGGILTDTLSWRFVLFVNVPIGLFVGLLAPRVLVETSTRRGRLDLPGAITASAGMTLLVYGLIHAASTTWTSTWTILPLVAGAALLVMFVGLEARSSHALMPLHLFRNRNRSTAYLTMLAVGTAIFSMFYFLTLFMQNILGYSPLRAGFAYLPFALMIIVAATAVSRAVGRVGPKAPLLIGTALAGGGLLWFSQLSTGSTYWANLIGPMLMVSGGMAMSFVPLTLSAVSGVKANEAGIASALLNSGQMVGGSLGLAVLGTIAATVTRHQATNVIGHYGPRVAGFFQAQPPPPHAHLAPALHTAISTAYLNGYTTAMLVGGFIMLAASALVAIFMRTNLRPATAPAEAGTDASGVGAGADALSPAFEAG